MKKYRGVVIAPVILIVAGVVVGALAGGAGVYYLMSRNKGGTGMAEENTAESIAVDITESVEISTEMLTIEPTEITETTEATEPTTEPTEPTTEPTEPSTEFATVQETAIEITISGNRYLYDGNAYTLEEITDLLKTNHTLSVTLTDDNASLRAYTALEDALSAMGLQINNPWQTEAS